MEPPEHINGSPSGSAPTGTDLVVIDRQALRQMLTAVLKALQATANLDELEESEETDPGQISLLRANMRAARDRLMAGIEQIAGSVERLPSVKLRDNS